MAVEGEYIPVDYGTGGVPEVEVGGTDAGLGKAIEEKRDYILQIKDVGVLIYDAGSGLALLTGRAIKDGWYKLEEFWNSAEGESFFAKLKSIFQAIWDLIARAFNACAQAAIDYRANRQLEKKKG